MRRLAVFLLLAAGPALAQPVRTDSLGEVTVTAARVPLAPLDAPARATVLPAESATEAGAATVAEWLEARAPLHVRRYGPAGLASVTMRGASAAQTLVVLDGVPLSDPQLGPLDLALLPTALLGGAEVRHGAGAHLYGSGAVGGVVHLGALAEGPALRVGSGAGAWGERTLSGLARGTAWTPLGRIRALVAAEGVRAEDDYGVTDLSRLDRPTIRRAGWDRQRAAGYGALALDGHLGTLAISAWGLDAERGLGGTDSVGARQWDRLGRLAVRASTGGERLRVEATGAVQRGSLRYASPFHLGTEEAVGAQATDDTGRTTVASGDLRADAALAGWTLTASAHVARGTADHPSLSAGAADDRLGLALAASPASGTLRVYPALRLDHHRPAGGDARTALTPSLGANLRLAPGLHAKASAGTAFRLPTLNDRFWRPGGTPDLRPERAVSADAGLAFARGGTRAEGTAFWGTTRDQIVWRPLAGGVWSPTNLARTRALGLEASASLARPLRLGPRDALAEAGLVATLTDARDRSDPDASAYGQQLRLVPCWTASAWGGVEVSRLGTATVRLGANARAVGRRATTDSGSASLPPYAVFGAGVRAAMPVAGASLTLSLRAENLLDTRYEVVPTYVMPPRHLRATLSLSIP